MSQLRTMSQHDRLSSRYRGALVLCMLLGTQVHSQDFQQNSGSISTLSGSYVKLPHRVCSNKSDQNTYVRKRRYRSKKLLLSWWLLLLEGVLFFCLRRYSIRFAKIILNLANALKNAQPTSFWTMDINDRSSPTSSEPRNGAGEWEKVDGIAPYNNA